eukprot:scaffold89955_cov47-Phaeocystis_antarctica.AAC.1
MCAEACRCTRWKERSISCPCSRRHRACRSKRRDRDPSAPPRGNLLLASVACPPAGRAEGSMAAATAKAKAAAVTAEATAAVRAVVATAAEAMAVGEMAMVV